MNKRTRAIDEDTYKLIIATMKNGFVNKGVQYKPNERIATILVLEYNLGLRVGDILQLKVDSFVKDGSRYRLDIYEQKTNKYGISTVDDYMNEMVLLSNWGARDNVSITKIPAGTKIKYAIGTAREQVGAIESRPGGGLQILFEEFDDGWVWDTRPLP